MAGTACGGMDQTISIMGQRGTAKFIDFVPEIKATTVSMPANTSFVIGNSCTDSPKILTVGTRYNKRVVECRFACAAMALGAGVAESFESNQFKTFEQLQSHLKYSFDEMINLCKESFKRTTEYTPQMISTEFRVKDPFTTVQDVPHVNEVQSRNASFHLYNRAMHVLTEAKRVHKFREICEDKDMADEKKATLLGILMNESHFSCRDKYECSSSELDELTDLCRKSGALGSRLTGAGWGGCCVSLVRNDDLKSFIDQVYGYYEKVREKGTELWITDDLERYLFATQPAQGASIIDAKFTFWHQ